MHLSVVQCSAALSNLLDLQPRGIRRENIPTAKFNRWCFLHYTWKLNRTIHDLFYLIHAIRGMIVSVRWSTGQSGARGQQAGQQAGMRQQWAATASKH
jgi:hypothetical protein